MQEIFCSIYRLHGIKNDRLDLTVSMQKTVLTNMHALGPEILTKVCQNSGCQTKPSYFETFWPISRDSVRIFQNRFLHWNRELKSVVLSTIKPINETKKVLPHKWVQAYLLAKIK